MCRAMMGQIHWYNLYFAIYCETQMSKAQRIEIFKSNNPAQRRVSYPAPWSGIRVQGLPWGSYP